MRSIHKNQERSLPAHRVCLPGSRYGAGHDACDAIMLSDDHMTGRRATACNTQELVCMRCAEDRSAPGKSLLGFQMLCS